jgi:hypothetical protein
MKKYKALSFVGAVAFVACGVFFLIYPNRVYIFFNIISIYLGMQRTPVTGFGFFQIYTVGYFYITAVLTFLMYRNPENRQYPALLANGCFAVSVLSISLFLIHKPYLIYISSGLANGIIGVLALIGLIKMKKNISKEPASKEPGLENMQDSIISDQET